jgi:tRNA dimethylallyltransferase
MAANTKLTKLPLVVIVGPTASGKTSLAIEIAKQFGGEIICADSRTIYKGMDIGTAKPTKAEMQSVPHWGLDLVEPGEYFSAADFKEYAELKIQEIRARGHIPFLVGGTGLYVDAVIFDYQFGPQADPAFRAELEAMTLEELHDYCKQNSVSLPENDKNKRYVIRAIEQKSINTLRRNEPVENCIIVGITTDRQTLRDRIKLRSEQLFDDGVVEEATLLGKKYGWESEAMTGNIYPLVHAYLEKELTIDEVKDKFTTLDWRLAKRQMTWLRRNTFIWWGSLTEVRERLLNLLANV